MSAFTVVPGYTAGQEKHEITFEVEDGDGDPVVGATVLLEHQDKDIMYEGETDEDGNITFTATEGDYEYSVSKFGYDNIEDEPINVVEDMDITVTMEETDTVEVTLTVEDTTGDAIEGVKVEFESHETGAIEYTNTTNETGVVVFDEVVHGEYTWIVSHEEYADKTDSYTATGETFSDTITLDKLFDVTFIIEEEDTEDPIEGAEIWLIHEEDIIDEGETDVDGELVFEDVAEGEYEYSVLKYGYQDIIHDDFMLAEGENETIEVNMTEANTYNITFEVEDTANEGIENATVELVHSRTGEFEADNTTDDAGVTVIEDLYEDLYDYTVSHENYSDVTGTITLDENKTETVTMSGLFEITFSVEDEAEDPIEGAWVELVRDDEEYEYEGETDADGNITFEEVVEGTYDYTVTKFGYVEVSESITVDEDDNVSVTMAEASTYDITFEVTDEGTGEAIEGALVELESHETGEIFETNETDENGEAGFYEVVEGDYDYTVTNESYFDESETITVDDQLPDPVEVTMTQAEEYEITFAVEDTTSARLEGADIELEHQGMRDVEYSEETGEEGNVTFEVYEGDYDYTVTKFGYEEATGEITVEADGDWFGVTVEELEEYEITFEAEGEDTGEPLEGVWIELESEVSGEVEYDGYTDEDGELVFENVYEGHYTGTAFKFGYEELTGPVEVEEDETIPVEMTELDEYDITFEVEDEETEDPIEGAWVEVESHASGEVEYEGETDEDGNVTFEVYEGDYDYEVIKFGYEEVTDTIEVDADENISVEMTELEEYEVIFTVEDGEEDPVEDATVELVSEVSGEIEYEGETDEEGNITFENVYEGGYDYTVYKIGYKTVTGEIDVTENITEEITMEEADQYNITFEVEDTAGEGIGNATVELEHQLTGEDYTNETDDDGVTVIEDVYEGMYDYTVSHDDYEDVTGEIEVVEDETVEVTMYELFEIIFSVEDEDEEPIEDAWVSLEEDTHEGYTDADGNITFEEVVEGTYTYEVSKFGYEDESDTIDVDADDTIEVTMTEAPQYEITFDVEDGDGDPIEGAWIELESHVTGEVEYENTTDEDGEAGFEVYEGIYDYTITKFGYEDATGEIDVTEDDVISVTMEELEEYEIVFEVEDEDEEPIEGVTIELESHITGEVEYTNTTNETGVAVFHNVYEGDYEYTASHDDYEDVTDEITVDEDTTIPVTMVFIEHTLTIDSTEGGEVIEPGEGTFDYDHDEVVDLEAVADEGYHFVEWTGDVETIEDVTANATTIEMLDDYSITAEFEEDVEDIVVEEFWVNGEEEEVEVEWDEDVEIYAEITNNMDVEVQMVVTVEEDGEEVHSWDEEVPAGETGEIHEEHDHETWYAGEFVVRLEVEDVERTIDVTVLEPEAYFEVEITDYDDEVEEGDTVTVEFTIENTGDAEGTQDIVFNVDGTEEDSVEVTLDVDETYDGEFEWEAEEAGDYDLEVASEDDSDSVTVTVEEDEPIDMMMIAGIILIIIIILAIIGYMMKGGKEEEEMVVEEEEEEMFGEEELGEEEEEELFGEEEEEEVVEEEEELFGEEEETTMEEEDEIFEEPEETEEDLFEEEEEEL